MNRSPSLRFTPFLVAKVVALGASHGTNWRPFWRPSELAVAFGIGPREADSGTDLIYLDESFGGSCCVVSALAIRDNAWNDAFQAIQDWRKSLRTRFGIPLKTELHASILVSGRGSLGPQIVEKNERVTIFREGLQLLADLGPGKIWITNSCPPAGARPRSPTPGH